MTVPARSWLVLSILLTSVLAAAPARAATAGPASRNLPLSFEPNLGQTDPRVKFLARTPGMTLFLTPTETVFLTAGNAVRIRLLGASPDSEIQGVDKLPGRSHWLIGRDPSRWRTNAPTYGRVKHRGI